LERWRFLFGTNLNDFNAVERTITMKLLLISFTLSLLTNLTQSAVASPIFIELSKFSESSNSVQDDYFRSPKSGEILASIMYSTVRAGDKRGLLNLQNGNLFSLAQPLENLSKPKQLEQAGRTKAERFLLAIEKRIEPHFDWSLVVLAPDENFTVREYALGKIVDQALLTVGGIKGYQWDQLKFYPFINEAGEIMTLVKTPLTGLVKNYVFSLNLSQQVVSMLPVEVDGFAYGELISIDGALVFFGGEIRTARGACWDQIFRLSSEGLLKDTIYSTNSSYRGNCLGAKPLSVREHPIYGKVLTSGMGILNPSTVDIYPTDWLKDISTADRIIEPLQRLNAWKPGGVPIRGVSFALDGGATLFSVNEKTYQKLCQSFDTISLKESFCRTKSQDGKSLEDIPANSYPFPIGSDIYAVQLNSLGSRLFQLQN
jgi:hypothetical protein